MEQTNIFNKMILSFPLPFNNFEIKRRHFSMIASTESLIGVS